MGDPEVEQARAAPVLAALDDDVGGLDVAVDHPVGVRPLQRQRHVADQRDGGAQRQARPGAPEGRERLPGGPLHDEAGDPVELIDRQHLDHVRVLDRHHRPGLLAKPQPLLQARLGGPHLLDRDRSVGLPVVGLVDSPHAALGDIALDGVAVPEDGAWGELLREGGVVAHRLTLLEYPVCQLHQAAARRADEVT